MICDYWGVLIMERGRLFITQTAEECAVVQWDEWKTSCVDAVCAGEDRDHGTVAEIWV